MIIFILYGRLQFYDGVVEIFQLGFKMVDSLHHTLKCGHLFLHSIHLLVELGQLEAQVPGLRPVSLVSTHRPMFQW